MKKIFSVLITLSFVILSSSGFSQIIGGGNGTPETSEAKTNKTGGEALSSNVNLMNGTLQTSYSLGSVSTPTGLTYSQTLSYSSTYTTGDNTPFMSGIPYGEGWTLNVPSITIKTATKHKYTPNELENFRTNTQTVPVNGRTYDNQEAAVEGDVEYFSPEINIPGIVSGRLVFKGFTYTNVGGTVREAVFVLHNFSDIYIEVTLKENNTWEALLPDGSIYVFAERKNTVYNATNQRFDDNVSVEKIIETRDPKKITTTWFVSYIENPSQHKHYRIIFNYNKLGKFDFHREQLYFYDQAGYPAHYQLRPTWVYRDIFLKNVSAAYIDPETITYADLDDPNNPNSIPVIELEKLDFIYEEDLNIRKPSGMTTLPGVLFTNENNVEEVDDLYNRIIVYNAKDNLNKFNNWRRYEHVRRDMNSFDIMGSKTNPYLVYGGSSNQYKRSEISSSTSLAFQHSFLESPRVDISTTSGISNMPPGDLYQIFAEIDGGNKAYCNFDINIVSGSTGQDNSSLPQGTSYYNESNYKSARHTTLFTTFGNQNKWNPNLVVAGNLKTYNYFTMPNLPNGFGGFFIQIGPGNSDNVFDLSNSQVFTNTPITGEEVLQKTYPQRNYSADPYLANRPTASIPFNFGTGHPWYNEYKVLDKEFGPSFPNFSNPDLIDKIYSKWFEDVGGDIQNHNPTLTSQYGDMHLKELKVYRYSKKPYVLKKVKHYKLKGDGVGGVKSEMYQDDIIELKYAIIQAAAYENIVMISEPLPTAQQVEISKRYIVTLVQIEESSSSANENRPTINFDYKLTPPTNKVNLIQDYNTNYYSYTSNGDNVVLTRITDQLGKQRFISYYNLDDYETTQIKLSENKTRYYPDPDHRSNSTPIYMGPSYAFKINRAVKEIKTETANSTSGSIFSVKTYYYDSDPLTGTFKTYVEPRIPIYSNSSSTSTHNYITQSARKELHGFAKGEVHYRSNSSNPVEKITVTEHNFTHHLWGKLSKVTTYSGSVKNTTNLLSEEIYTYESIKAFENGLKRPGYSTIHFDYHDYWETDGLILPGMSGPIYNGYVSTYKVKVSSVGSESFRMNKLKFKESIRSNGLGRFEKKPEVNYLLTYSNYSDVQTNNSEYLDANFVKLTKKETKLYDLSSSHSTTTINEFDYFDADYKGKSTSKGYDYILKSESSVSSPHRLWFVPSWMPYSTTTYNLETPDKKSVEENFYYYDLKNEYGCFAENFDQYFPFSTTNDDQGSNSLNSKGLMDFTPNGLGALSYSNYYGIRNILMENRKRGYKTNYEDYIHSTYYLYEVIKNAEDFSLNTSPFLRSSAIDWTPPTPPTPPGPGDPYNPKPGTTTLVNISGNDYNPNTWGSTGPLEMGPSPDLDPTLVVIHSNDVIDWFSHPIIPRASHDLVVSVYNETNTTAGKKIHTYLTSLNGQISITLEEYLKSTHPLEILEGIIPSYNPNDEQQHNLGTFMLRGIHMVKDQLIIDSIPLSNYLDSVDSDSLDKIVYSSDYPLEIRQDNDHLIDLNDKYHTTDKDITLNALRLSEVKMQIDNVVLDDFNNKNSGYNYTNLPPILQFEHIPPPPSNSTAYHEFTPLFPYKTLRTKKVNKLNKFGGIAEEEDRNGVVTKNELFPQTLVYWRDGINGPIKDIKLITQPINAIQKSTKSFEDIYSTTLFSYETNYEYYPHGLVKKITKPNGEIEEFQYDELHRLYKTIKDSKLFSINRYSNFPVNSIYNNPDLLSNRSSNYSLTSVDFENRALANFNEIELIFDANSTTQYGNISRNFFDPLGRKHQSASQNIINNSSNPKIYDSKTYHSGKTEYDSRNLPGKFFKPFEVGTGASTLSLSIKTNPALNPLFKETEYETSIQARPVKASDYGVSISSSQVSTKDYYWLDKSGLESELQLTVTERNLIMPLYSSESYIFFKTINTDQDGKEVITYKDPTGAEVATKSYSDASKTTPIITLFIKNSQGLVQKVINPKKQESIYNYNILGWAYEEITPDKGITRFMYNKLGLVTLMQDENARNGVSNGDIPYYIENKYDELGRHTESNRVNVDHTNLGITNCGDPITGLCAQLSPLGLTSTSSTVVYSNQTEDVCFVEQFSSSKTYDWEFNTAKKFYYNCENLNMNLTVENFKDLTPANIKPIVKNYYDDKPALSNEHSLIFTPSGNENTKSRLVASISYNNLGDPIQYKYFIYFSDGKLKTEQHQFNESGIDIGAEGRVVQIDYGYTYKDQLEHKNIWLQDGLSPTGAFTSVNKQYFYEYDAFNRLKNIYFNKGTLGGGMMGTKIATYTYNNVFGFVEKINYYGFNHYGCKDLDVDEITFDRTTDARNRLTKINSKFFDWEIYYDADVPTLTNTGFSNTQDLPNNSITSTNYNGNINFTIAKYRLNSSAFPTGPPTPPIIGNGPSNNLFAGKTVYRYDYDGLNRLTKADATIEDHIIENHNYPSCNDYGDVSFTYDKIGNFEIIKRYNNVSDPANTPSISFLNMNDFDYSQSNRLIKITEQNGNRTTDYTYDNNGNVISDNFRHIVNTKYNEANLPYELVVDKSSQNPSVYIEVDYLYDEGGFRLFKQTINGGITTKEYYIKDATGQVVAILDLQNTQVQQWNIEGIAKAKPVTDGDDLYYYVKDHLGNTRITYNPFMCQTCGSGCNIQEYKFEHAADYYPFGKILREYNPAPFGKEKYLTTGNERDTETEWDYRNARYYDAEIGRFLAIDPLANELPTWSSYVGLNDNPLYFIDPKGLKGEGVDGGPGQPCCGGFNPYSGWGSLASGLQKFFNESVNSLTGGFRGNSEIKLNTKNVATKNSQTRTYDFLGFSYNLEYRGWDLFSLSNSYSPRLLAPKFSINFSRYSGNAFESKQTLAPGFSILYAERRENNQLVQRTYRSTFEVGKSLQRLAFARTLSFDANGDWHKSNVMMLGPSFLSLYGGIFDSRNSSTTELGIRSDVEMPLDFTGRTSFSSDNYLYFGVRNK